MIFQGGVQVPNMGLRSVGKSGIDARQSQVIAAMYKGTPLQQPVSAGFAVRGDLDEGIDGRDAGGQPQRHQYQGL